MRTTPNEHEIDISGMDLAAVLAALYNASYPPGLGALNLGAAQSMTTAEAAVILQARSSAEGGNLYFDYLNGRVMKVNLGPPFMDTRLYDRDNGQGAARTALEHLITPDQDHRDGN